MISRQDILDRAAEWRLRPEVVEKDYVLGWLLAGLATLPARAHWIFKGGTCIKKCFFETYRFSEDLDFSLLPEAPYAEEELRAGLVALVRTTHEISGITFPEDLVVARPRQNRQGQRTYECRIAYRGPLAFPGEPRRVLFDLTQHEVVLDEPDERGILHPYPDFLPEGATVRTYAFDELLGEKTRALFERTRPRDLYDVVYLLENQPESFHLGEVRELFVEKCRGKNLAPPSVAELLAVVREAEELRSEWVNMLGHQLPSLPNLDSLLLRLGDLLAWIDEPAALPAAAQLLPAPVAAGTTSVAPAGIQYWGGGIPLETLRFAGSNRLLVAFDYDGKARIAEPYSLRRASTGNLLLYAWEQGSTHIKAFSVAKLQNLRVTQQAFEPRYRIELTAEAPLSITPSRRRASPLRPSAARAPRRRQSALRRAGGPRYVFQCISCGRRFTKARNDATLGRHKTPGGWACPSRRGYLVEIR
jgi:predicted nucleotidyltransferase component of viral defense system